MRQALRLLKGAYFWVMGVSATIFFCLMCGVMHLVTRALGRPLDGRLVHPVAAAWGRTVFHLTPGWHMQVEGKEHLPPDGKPAIVVANHESMTDIFVMCFLPIQFRWLSKAEVFDMPLVGQAMGWARYVPVRRGDRGSHSSALAESRQRIEMGLCMLFFPEGTRSHDGVIREFKTGAFRLARDTQTPIVPVVLKGTRDLMPKHGRIPKPAFVRICVLPPVPPPPPEGRGEELEAYAARVREAIVTRHASI